MERSLKFMIFGCSIWGLERCSLSPRLALLTTLDGHATRVGVKIITFNNLLCDYKVLSGGYTAINYNIFTLVLAPL